MTITADMVKTLRERTGSGMMECKKALVEAAGDIDLAIENMRKAGLAKADKKSGRTAAEGALAIETSPDRRAAVIVEVNSETDFVAKSDEFQTFVQAVARTALESGAATLEQLLAVEMQPGVSVDQMRRELVARLGENIAVRRLARVAAEDGQVASYLHGTKIGVLVALRGGDAETGRDVAMHVAASRPLCVEESEVPAELVAKEREVYLAQAETSGKPQEIVEKMVEGRVKKYLAEVTLIGQPFVKDPNQTVGKLLASKGATVQRFVRLEVGEGIEKEVVDFAADVMAQARSAS